MIFDRNDSESRAKPSIIGKEIEATSSQAYGVIFGRKHSTKIFRPMGLNQFVLIQVMNYPPVFRLAKFISRVNSIRIVLFQSMKNCKLFRTLHVTHNVSPCGVWDTSYSINCLECPR
ncbi:hypothetical protein LMG33810_002852 [Carnimonas sp. LMG 33810]